MARRLVRWVYVAMLVAGDVVAIGVSFVAGYKIQAAMEQRANRLPPLEDYLPTLGFLIGSLLVSFALMRLYLPRRGASHSEQLGSIFLAVTIGNVVAMAVVAFTLRGLDVPRLIVVYTWGLSILAVWVSRSLMEQALRATRRAGLDLERVLIIGAGEDGRAILHKIASAPHLGYQVVGFIEQATSQPATDRREESSATGPSIFSPSAPPILGSLSDLTPLLRRHEVSEVVVADPRLTHAEILDIVAACDRGRVNVKVFPDIFHLVMREVSVSELGGLPMLRVRDVNLRGWNLLVKRALDVVISAALLVLLSPVIILVAILVKLTSPRGPVFFIQERVGVDGRPFACVKFRSMRVDAEAETGPVWALKNDARTTGLGRCLRRFSIDELPQLVNVLLGDMSLVGPRPERPYFVEEFKRLIPRYDKRHQEKAGVTGWAQVNGLRGQTSIEERTLYDLYYVEHWSPGFDLSILIKTVAAVIRGRNAY